ncbi:poly hydrolase [Mycena floridula]|nr:poly hydrolase [Mycena floridula]
MLIEKLKDLPHNHPHIRLLSGRTPFFASTYDQRFSFGLQIPKSHRFNGPSLPLLVVVHGTSRNTGGYLSKLKDFSDSNNCVILTPLFPAGIEDPEDMMNYHNVLYHSIRFDIVLLKMIEQASEVWRIYTDKFYLHGFSGGGQFAHRFLYLHPERLLAVSIGAPGRFTSPTSKEAWPAGLANVAEVFPDVRVDLGQVRKVPVQFVVGELDVETALLDLAKPSKAEGEAGRTRVERIRWLKTAFEEVGVRSELMVVTGVGHEGLKCLPVVEEWFIQQLKA